MISLYSALESFMLEKLYHSMFCHHLHLLCLLCSSILQSFSANFTIFPLPAEKILYLWWKTVPPLVSNAAAKATDRQARLWKNAAYDEEDTKENEIHSSHPWFENYAAVVQENSEEKEKMVKVSVKSFIERLYHLASCAERDHYFPIKTWCIFSLLSIREEMQTFSKQELS